MSRYRQRKYTAAELGELYDRSKRFREAVAKAVRRIDRKAKPSEVGRELATSLADIANRAGEYIGTVKSPRIPDPELILRWMANYKPGDGWQALDRENPYLDAVVGSLLKSAKMPWKLASEWSRIAGKLVGNKQANPFFFTRSIYAMLPPASRMHRGLVLTRIRIRIPFGYDTRRDAQGNPYAVPAEWSYRDLNFESPDMVARFGQVWLGISEDGKSIWIASEKLPRITLEQLLSPDRDGITEGSGGYYRPFNEPYATRGRVRGPNEVPPTLKPPDKAKTA